MTPIFIKALKQGTPKPKKAEEIALKTAVKTPEEIGAKTAVKTPDGKKPAKNRDFSGLLAILAEHNSGREAGPQSVKKGHHVAFKAGTFTGSGKVCSTGQDGLTVTDAEARDHRIHWHEVTGHKPQGKDAK